MIPNLYLGKGWKSPNIHLSHEKKSGYFGYMLGMKSYPIAIMINHDIRIPIKQPVQRKVRGYFS